MLQVLYEYVCFIYLLHPSGRFSVVESGMYVCTRMDRLGGTSPSAQEYSISDHKNVVREYHTYTAKPTIAKPICALTLDHLLDHAWAGLVCSDPSAYTTPPSGFQRRAWGATGNFCLPIHTALLVRVRRNKQHNARKTNPLASGGTIGQAKCMNMTGRNFEKSRGSAKQKAEALRKDCEGLLGCCRKLQGLERGSSSNSSTSSTSLVV